MTPMQQFQLLTLPKHMCTAQSFEVGNLKYLSRKTCIPLVQLLSDWNT